MLAASTGRFTAVASVAPAGNVRPLDVFHVPVWVFHGRNDAVIKSGTSEKLIKSLLAMGADPDHARLTLYEKAPPPPGASAETADGHGAALLAYRTPELFEWFLSHRGNAGPGGDGRLRRIADPRSYEAFIHVPPGNAPPTGWPLMIYLHGGPETGTDLNMVRSPGAAGPVHRLSRGRCIPELSERFVVVAPQAPRADKGWRKEKVVQLLDFLLVPENCGVRVDRQRVYVTGSSNGGFGALIAASTGRFAAVAPVAVAGIVVPRDVRHVPVWAFHGKNDAVIPFSCSADLIAGLQALGAEHDDAKLTLYEEAPAPPGNPEHRGHGSGVFAYRTPELFDWFLARRLQTQDEL